MEENVFNEIVVVKRSGQRVSFNEAKIALAIKKGFDSVYEHYDEKKVNIIFESVLDYIKQNYIGRKTINVEDVQDIIENELKKHNFNDVFTSFNKYRERRAITREIYEEKREHKFVKSIEKLASSYDEILSETPKKTLMNLGKTISSEYSKAYIIESKFVRAHEEGKIYIHNIDYFSLGMPNYVCLDLNHINYEDNYFNNIIKIILGTKEEQFGEVLVPSFDSLLEKYVINKFKSIYKEYLINYLDLEGLLEYINIFKLKEEIDKLETILFEDNIFNKFILNKKTNYIFLKAKEDSNNKLKILLEKNIKKFLYELNEYNENNKLFSISIGTNKTYEGMLISECLLTIIESEKTFNNICIIYKLNKNNQLLEKIINLINKNKFIGICNEKMYNKTCDNRLDAEFFSDGKIIYDNIYKDKEYSMGRMILGSISINLTLLALKSKNIKEFYKVLEENLELAKNELITKFEYIAGRCKENFKYLFNNSTLEKGQRVRKLIKHGSLNIELVGLYETIKILSSNEIFEKKDLDLMFEILKFIRKKLDKYTLSERFNFVLSETNEKQIKEELLSIDKSLFGSIKGITDKKEYSNINEIFDKLKLDKIERLKYESNIQKIMNGGYLIKSNNKSVKEIKNIINKMLELDVRFVLFDSKEMLL